MYTAQWRGPALLIATVFLLGAGCSKEGFKGDGNATSVAVHVHVDGQVLKGDTLLYQNDAGERYSVSRLEFYLSDFRFYRGDALICVDTGVYYVHASPGYLPQFELACNLEGHYDRVELLIGIDSLRNVHGALPNTLQNQHMVWPQPMGGGYHFLKLEGHYISAAGQSPKGYAMHIGTNACLIHVALEDVQIHPKKDNYPATLSMNLNAWYRYPEHYSFEQHGNYSMGDLAAMQMLVRNGAYVLKFE